jgi:hypothetical protein
MTQQARKKNSERELLSRFAEANPLLGVARVRDFESPDFICHTIDGECGIEVADFVFNPESVHHSLGIASDRKRMQKEMEAGHQERRLPPMNVWVRLLWHNKLRDTQFRKQLRDLLLDLIVGTGSTGWPAFTLEGVELGESLYDRGVSSVTMIGGPSVSRTLWNFPHAAWIPDSEPEMVQSLIDKKNSKVAAYRNTTARNWLLITAGPLGLDSMLEATDSILNATYKTNFNRVFLFLTFGTHTHQLKLCRSDDERMGNEI